MSPIRLLNIAHQRIDGSVLPGCRQVYQQQDAGEAFGVHGV